MNNIDTKHMSSRELIEELSRVTQALRLARKPDASATTAAASDETLVNLVRREQQIIHQLRHRARTHSPERRTGRARPKLF